MPALADIQAAILRAKTVASIVAPWHRSARFKVRVGRATELAIRVETPGHQLPVFIDGCVVERTTEYHGFEVIQL